MFIYQVWIHDIDTGERLHEIPATVDCSIFAVDLSKSGDFACSGGGGAVASVYSLRGSYKMTKDN